MTDPIILFKDEYERRITYIFIEGYERAWAQMRDRAVRKRLMLAFLRDVKGRQCRKNAGIWTILEMLFLELLKTNRLLIGHDQQLAETMGARQDASI